MARKPQVRYFASRNAYYTQHNGKQRKLAEGPDDFPTGPTYLAAQDAFKQLIQLGNVRTAKDRNTVRAVAETYMQHTEHKLAPNTFRVRKTALIPFVEKYGNTAVGDLTHFDVYAFIAVMRQPRRQGRRWFKWGDGAVRTFTEAIMNCLNWATKTKLITENPLVGIERPSGRSRSRDCLVSPEQHEKILNACRTKGQRQLVIALENTGARPGELVGATAADWQDDIGAIVYHADDVRREDEFRHKTAAHKERAIYFTGAALDMMRELVKENPTGRLFRNRRGKIYLANNVAKFFRPIRMELDMPHLTPYSYRHSFATSWLKANRSIDILASLLGNTPEIIRKHYSHLLGDHEGIRRHLEEFRAGGK